MLPHSFFDNIPQANAFRIAIVSLVDEETFLKNEHLLEVISPEHYLSFVGLLREGVNLRSCFRELESFLIWQQGAEQLLADHGVCFGSVLQEVGMYLIEKRFEADRQIAFDVWVSKVHSDPADL